MQSGAVNNLIWGSYIFYSAEPLSKFKLDDIHENTSNYFEVKLPSMPDYVLKFSILRSILTLIR